MFAFVTAITISSWLEYCAFAASSAARASSFNFADCRSYWPFNTDSFCFCASRDRPKISDCFAARFSALSSPDIEVTVDFISLLRFLI